MKQDLIHRESARRIIESPRSKEQMLAVLEGLPPVEAELAKYSPKVENSSGDSIYRQAAIDVIFSEPLYETGMEKRSAEEVVPAIFEKIKALPSAQPEIIRCKDCKHYTLKPQVNSNYCYTRHCTRSALISSKPDDYCSWAERKTDDGE